MKLRRNEYCPIHALFPAAAESLFRKHEELNSLVCSALMIQIIRGDIGSCAPIERCGD
jgi:hypothetical protein